MYFYHVAREPININTEIKLILLSDFSDSNTVFTKEYIDEQKKYHPDGLSYFGIRHLFPGKDTQTNEKLKNQLRAENLYEETRRNFFPNKPSRFSSFFACKTLLDANKLINNEFKCSESHPPYKIYQIECRNYFIFDMNLLRTDFSKGKEEIKNFANRYWSQEKSNNPFWEVLCEPPIKIINL